MSSSVVPLHTEIRIAGSPSHSVPLIQQVLAALDGTEDLVGDLLALGREPDQDLVQHHVVEERDSGVVRQLLGHQARATTAALDQVGDPLAAQFAQRGIHRDPRARRENSGTHSAE